MRNIALKLMYVGTAYHGWQVQKNAATVQETLQNALRAVVGHSVHCVGAGRTDAGVHAEVYIANFQTASAIPTERLPLAVNAHLPDDIVVTAARQVSDKFNAIGSCLKKEYTYRVLNTSLPNAFYVNRVYFFPRRLDVSALTKAASCFVGEHDFSAVRSVGTHVKSTVRTVYYFDVMQKGDLLEMRVCANGFLYNMVRAMVGTILYVAEGKLTLDDVSGLLMGGDRSDAGPTVPPDGLYMTNLWYREPVGLETDPILAV